VPAAEAAAFAARTGCLFVEASAKTAVGVTEAFNDVVTRIIDTPSLWREEKSKSSPKSAAGALSGSANTTTGASRSRAGENMPGNIDLSQVQDEDTSAGCLC
jgi:Ras-related protein Rab-18